ncbi:MAG TPA: uroporphyrinogen-III C-methyltransferase [Polymorphobacter sp.]|nr:uroporphyrinogen-III C-methyltransferase [Polymorphobacter sp.]
MPEVRVWLVGAGPGDPELLTLKALRLIETADIILYDALVGAEILGFARPGTQLLAVGKRAGRHAMPQPAINAALVAAARGPVRVVRLKGGDPTIFGRLTEEMDALRRAGIPFEVVPGVTAACAAAAAAQVSLTRRGAAQSVTFVTGHAQAGTALDVDWPALVDTRSTLAIYMGKSAAREIRDSLLAHGLTATTPVRALADVGRAGQCESILTLGALDTVAEANGNGPLLILIGAAMSSTSMPNRRCSRLASQRIDDVVGG